MKNLILFLFLFTVAVVNAQPTGYAGRKLVVKTDVLNGRYLGGRNVEVEYPIIRKLSLVFGFRYHAGYHKQKFVDRDAEFIGVGSYYNGDESIYKAWIKAVTYKIQLKYYPNEIFSAPKGFFLYGSFEFGKASIEYAATLYESGNSTEIMYKNLDGIKVKQYDLGIGFQEIIWELLVIECSGGLNASRFNGSGSESSQKYTTSVARSYGPNLLPFGKGAPDGTDLSPLGNTDSEPRPFKGALGLSFNFKVGFLLF